MKILLLSLLIAAAVSAQTPAPSQTTAPPGNAEAGKKLFVSDGCYQCHGYEAQGSNATGPRLGPRPIAFAAFSRYVRQPTGQMPPYTVKVVSDADLTNIYAFVLWWRAPATNIPLLKNRGVLNKRRGGSQDPPLRFAPLFLALQREFLRRRLSAFGLSRHRDLVALERAAPVEGDRASTAAALLLRLELQCRS